MIQFPEVVGEDLLGNEILVPTQLREEFNILVVAFQRWHQRLVNTWVPFLNEIVEKYPHTEFYELPTIREMNRLYRFFINSGMRSGIPSEETRGRTITLYIDKEAFDNALGIRNEDDIYIYLVKRTGQILWQATGQYTEESGESLDDALETATGHQEEN